MPTTPPRWPVWGSTRRSGCPRVATGSYSFGASCPCPGAGWDRWTTARVRDDGLSQLAARADTPAEWLWAMRDAPSARVHALVLTRLSPTLQAPDHREAWARVDALDAASRVSIWSPREAVDDGASAYWTQLVPFERQEHLRTMRVALLSSPALSPQELAASLSAPEMGRPPGGQEACVTVAGLSGPLPRWLVRAGVLAHPHAAALQWQAAMDAPGDEQAWLHAWLLAFGPPPPSLACWTWLGDTHGDPRLRRAALRARLLHPAADTTDRQAALERLLLDPTVASPAMVADVLAEVAPRLGPVPDVRVRAALLALPSREARLTALQGVAACESRPATPPTPGTTRPIRRGLP